MKPESRLPFDFERMAEISRERLNEDRLVTEEELSELERFIEKSKQIDDSAFGAVAINRGTLAVMIKEIRAGRMIGT